MRCVDLASRQQKNESSAGTTDLDYVDSLDSCAQKGANTYEGARTAARRHRKESERAREELTNNDKERNDMEFAKTCALRFDYSEKCGEY
ncbi:unnamed protein product [Ceratitis capitata]|uniref:(Mediterranean fruit fly) hypothetical protein n=1 Tax=Ceratitis capitata TaxID=7213 RepID=A0A811U0E3_CERCA|nr:unnamed protein product [Ceratitis capitata]